VTGGIYTVDRHEPQDFTSYLAPAIAACPDCVVGLHWYGDTSDSWLARVQALEKPVAITEFGMPSCTAEQDKAQRVYLEEKLAAFARIPALAAIVYQRPSAPEPCNNSDKSHLAHFGLQRPDGSWKPGESVLK
jgi:Glycosyl hydrolase catalytic core